MRCARRKERKAKAVGPAHPPTPARPNPSLKGTRGYALVCFLGVRPPAPLSFGVGRVEVSLWQIVQLIELFPLIFIYVKINRPIIQYWQLLFPRYSSKTAIYVTDFNLYSIWNKPNLELADLADRLGKLQVASEDEIAAQGLMLGAIYSLSQAAKLEYSDSRNTAGKGLLATEFVRTAAALAINQMPDTTWLAGFYFSSALMRIAALNERLDKMAGTKVDSAADIRRTVNKLKHHPDAHVRGDWTVTFAGTLQSLSNLCQQLEVIVGTKHDG